MKGTLADVMERSGWQFQGSLCSSTLHQNSFRGVQVIAGKDIGVRGTHKSSMKRVLDGAEKGTAIV
jgi:hypothetical protein